MPKTNKSIVAILSELLLTLEISYEKIVISEVGPHPLFTIMTKDSAVLIGPRGEHLKALNYIVKRIVDGVDSHSKATFLVDVNDYHKKTIERLQQQARSTAERVKAFKHPAEMEPMTAYERMIVHATLSTEKEVETKSDGEGKYRHVVVEYKA